MTKVAHPHIKKPIGTNSSGHSPLFIVVSILFFALCCAGGFFGFIGEYFLHFPFNITIPAGKFIILYCLTWAFPIAMLFLFPKNLSFRNTSFLIIFIALLCRLILLPHEHSDDINRYLWEGELVNHGINPYVYAPDAPMLSDMAAKDPFHQYINHPENPAAYPPLMLYFFQS